MQKMLTDVEINEHSKHSGELPPWFKKQGNYIGNQSLLEVHIQKSKQRESANFI